MALQDELKQPDLRTLTGASQFLRRKNVGDQPELNRKLELVEEYFQNLLHNLWVQIPEGPGRTRVVHALNRARMECSSVIVNHGA